MATLVKSPVGIVETSHDYHAEAHVLSGHLEHPVKQPIQHHALVVLNDRRGGHFTQTAEDFSLEGLITFASGRTRVSGSPSLKPGHGWVTLSTSILEGLNVFEVITADRVVAQVSTEHPKVDGHVPHVTFLGTRFENFRIGGYPVTVELDLGICGAKPDGDKPYTQDPEFLDRVAKQCASISSHPDVPDAVKTQYLAEIAYIDRLKEQCNAPDGADNSGRKKGSGDPPVKCSLVKSIGKLPPGVRSFGNVLEIPGFGVVTLAEIEVGSKAKSTSDDSDGYHEGTYFTLKMFDMKLGCIGAGAVQVATASSNGKTKP